MNIERIAPLARRLALLLLAWSALFGLLMAATAARAHEVRPCFLEIKETAPGRFDVLWRTPVLAGARLPVVLKLPDSVQNLVEPQVQELSDSLVERRSIDAGPDGLAGKRIEFPGLQFTITDVLVRVQKLDGTTLQNIVRPAQAWLDIGATQAGWQVMLTYAGEGIRHILFGADHLLFVLGLLLIVSQRWMLVKTVTAFTVAHSITLAARHGRPGAAAGAAAERGHRAQHPVPRPRGGARMARPDQLHDPPPVGRGLRLRPAARLRLRRRR